MAVKIWNLKAAAAATAASTAGGAKREPMMRKHRSTLGHFLPKVCVLFVNVQNRGEFKNGFSQKSGKTAAASAWLNLLILKMGQIFCVNITFAYYYYVDYILYCNVVNFWYAVSFYSEAHLQLVIWLRSTFLKEFKNFFFRKLYSKLDMRL